MAIGGMAAQIPIKGDPEANEIALGKGDSLAYLRQFYAGEEGLLVMEILDAIYQSAEEGRPVRIVG